MLNCNQFFKIKKLYITNKLLDNTYVPIYTFFKKGNLQLIFFEHGSKVKKAKEISEEY